MNRRISIKVGMLGDAQIGKTTFMVRYVQETFDDDYIQTLGIAIHNPVQELISWRKK